MSGYWAIWRRGFLIVTLTALNTGQIAGQHWIGAGLVGFGISYIWWGNANRAAHAELRWACEAYACGAMCGTLFGMLINRCVYG